MKEDFSRVFHHEPPTPIDPLDVAPCEPTDYGDTSLLPPEKKHPWDVNHPYIERVAEGWRRKGEPRPRSFYWEKRPDLVDHPVLYKLFFRRYHDLRPDQRLNLAWLGEDFRAGLVITDEQLSEVPDPKRWPPSITHRWPELITRVGSRTRRQRSEHA